MGAMKVVIFGAGAVGAVVGALLARAGHEISFWLRPGRARPAVLSVERDGQRVSIAPRSLSAGDTVPESDWVIVCVRGEQLDGALRELATLLGSERRVAIATISLKSVTEQARAAGLRGEIYALHVSFAAYASADDPPLYRWFPFAPPSLVTPDGARAQLDQARALAAALERAGIEARARLSVTAPMRALSAVVTVFALAWGLCGWELDRFAREAGLRAETASALHEALGLVSSPRWPFRLVPRFVLALALRLLPWFVGARARALWRVHGPKIRAQNEHVTRELLAQAERVGTPAPALGALFARFRARTG
jgi:hypothetical protein